MLARHSILILVMAFVGWIAVSKLTPPATAGLPEDGIVRYVQADGWLELVINRSTRKSMSNPFPQQGAKTPSGHIITDTMSYEYGDCSNERLICADFGEFILSVPRHTDDALTWKQDGWTFRRTACLSRMANTCMRYVAAFQDAAAVYEGGFIYSVERGVEMYFNSNLSRKEPRQIYILATEHGLLHAGRP